MALCAHWIAGWRRGQFPVAAEPLEAGALLLLLHVAPSDPFLPLFCLVLRSMYTVTLTVRDAAGQKAAIKHKIKVVR